MDIAERGDSKPRARQTVNTHDVEQQNSQSEAIDSLETG
jgi:hypothetical protein